MLLFARPKTPYIVDFLKSPSLLISGSGGVCRASGKKEEENSELDLWEKLRTLVRRLLSKETVALRR